MTLNLTALEHYVSLITTYLASLIEISAAIIIGIACMVALYEYFAITFSKKISTKEEIRLKLGRSLAVSLEFLLGADILKTAVTPSWNDLGMLAAIAILRTALNYFLEKELQNNEKRKPVEGY